MFCLYAQPLPPLAGGAADHIACTNALMMMKNLPCRFYEYIFIERAKLSRGEYKKMSKYYFDRPANDRVPFELEKPIRSGIYPVIDTDLARDNLENDLTAADLQDL